MSPVRVAIVGTGGIAGVCHIPALRAERDRVEAVAAVDVDAVGLGTALSLITVRFSGFARMRSTQEGI